MRPRTKLGWCNATLMSLATVISCGLSGNGLSQAAVLGGSMVGTPGSSTNVVGEANTVTVTGFGSLTLNATVAQINLQISVSDNTVHNVLNDNRKFEQQAQSELKRLKIPTGDIRISTNGLSMGNGPAEQLYITVTIPNGSKVEQVMDSMSSLWGSGPTAPINVSVNVQYLTQSLKAARAQVFAAALADAKAQAAQLADNVGMRVGNVVSLETSLPNVTSYMGGPVGPYNTSNVSVGGIETSSGYPGNDKVILVTSQVTVTYRLVPMQGS